MIWLQRDHLGQLAGPDEYAYVMGEPRDAYDPYGLAADTFDGLELDGDAGLHKQNQRNQPRKRGDSNHNGAWTDEQDRAMYDEARRADKGFKAVGEIADAGTSFVPLKGEIDDLRVFYADDSTTWQRIGAGASLAVNFLTAGLLPNFGSGVKAAEAVDAANDLAQGGKAADKANEASKSIEAVNASENAKTAANAGKSPTTGNGCTKSLPAGKPAVPATRIGHDVPWGQMTQAQRSAFQHSYTRHGKELGLPNWRESDAANLQKQFNDVVRHIRESGTMATTPVFKPWNGRSVQVTYFEANLNGTRYYYYENAATGTFISAGRAR